MPTPGPERQIELYLQGAETDRCPIGYEEWEQRARAVLSAGPFDYIAGGCGGEETMRSNREAFTRWRIVPRVLRNVADRDLTVSLFGSTLSAPILLAPVGVQSIIHPQADRAPARAAARAGAPFVLSTVSSVTIEDTAAEMGTGTRWFQLYPGKDQELNSSLVHRAEAAGYSALVVTLDTPMIGWRERDLRTGYLPFLKAQGLANYLSDPVFRSRLDIPPEENPRPAIMHWFAIFGNPAMTWADLRSIRSQTSLPLILKGILHPGDARQALEAGVDGLIASNHGGRQVDGAIAALDALPSIVDAVGDTIPVLMDSGIRRGADVLKALALGARAVLLGRPYLYALAASGEAGVYTVIKNLIADFDLEMALSGIRTVREIDRSVLAEDVRQHAPLFPEA